MGAIVLPHPFTMGDGETPSTITCLYGVITGERSALLIAGSLRW